MFYRDIKQNLSNKTKLPKKINSYVYFCSAGHIYMLAGGILFKINTCLRAANFPFTGRNWLADRSLPTPDVDTYAIKPFSSFFV